MKREMVYSKMELLGVLEEGNLKESTSKLHSLIENKKNTMLEIVNIIGGNRIEEVIKNLDIQDKNRILELSHGNCIHLPKLLHEAVGLTYFGMETSVVMKAEASRINKKFENKRKALFQIYDGVNIPYVSKFFDRIISANSISFLGKSFLFLEEMYRVLKPGGVFVLSFDKDDFINSLSFSLNDNKCIEELIAKTDFILRSIETKTENGFCKNGDLEEREYIIVVLTKKEKLPLE